MDQTRRAITTRYKEHLVHFRVDKSSTALHMPEVNHKVDVVKLIQNVNIYVELNFYQSNEIYESKHIVMNSNLGPLNLYCLSSQEKQNNRRLSGIVLTKL